MPVRQRVGSRWRQLRRGGNGGWFSWLIDPRDVILDSALKDSVAECVDDVGSGDSAEPEDGVFGIGGFELEVHEV